MDDHETPEEARARNRKVERAWRRRGHVGPDFREWIFERDGWRCLACGTEDDLTVDHRIPLSLGGRTDPDNLRTLCRPCNSSRRYNPSAEEVHAEQAAALAAMGLESPF